MCRNSKRNQFFNLGLYEQANLLNLALCLKYLSFMSEYFGNKSYFVEVAILFTFWHTVKRQTIFMSNISIWIRIKITTVFLLMDFSFFLCFQSINLKIANIGFKILFCSIANLLLIFKNISYIIALDFSFNLESLVKYLIIYP